MNLNGPNTGVIATYGVAGVLYLAYFVSRVMYLLAVHRCLSRVHPRNRTMQPGTVWLDLIPLFSCVWSFVITHRLAESLDAEFYDRRIERDADDYGTSIGIASSVCFLLGSLTCGVMSIPAIILWIFHWVKVAGYAHELAADGEDYEEYDSSNSE
jgi:hypothetical protein